MISFIYQNNKVYKLGLVRLNIFKLKKFIRKAFKKRYPLGMEIQPEQKMFPRKEGSPRPLYFLGHPVDVTNIINWV